MFCFSTSGEKANTGGPINTETPNETETRLIRPDQLINLILLPLEAQIFKTLTETTYY